MTTQQKPRTAAQVWLKYGRDLNVREAEHALAGIDAEMARLRAENAAAFSANAALTIMVERLGAERDALSSGGEMSAWQPIDTAPRDGTMIIARNAMHGFIYVVGWQRAYSSEKPFDEDQPFDEDHWDDVGSRNAAPLLYFNANYFQHWMPIPAFP